MSSSADAARQPSRKAPRDSVRELLDLVVVAVSLAYLVKALVFELFVIPTGSMAPTLLGQHQAAECPQCGFEFAINASDGPPARNGSCPNCRFRVPLDDGPSHGGDRVVVAKFAYDWADPRRFAVPVFKYPGRAKVNYIKRVVGLPQETLVLYRGDVLRAEPGTIDGEALRDFRGQVGRRPPAGEHERSRLILGSQLHPHLDAGTLTICPKSPEQILATLQPVFATEHQPLALLAAGWPDRWQAEADAAQPTWAAAADHRRYELSAAAQQVAWLRYRHLAPSEPIWRRALQGALQPADLAEAQPQLITDFCAYNSNRGNNNDSGVNWAGDLLLEAQVSVAQRAGELRLQLVESGERFEARFDLARGDCTLTRSADAAWQRTSVRPVLADGTREFHVRFANVDNQLVVWLNDAVVEWSEPANYPLAATYRPAELDLTPAAIGLQGTPGAVTHIRLARDIYYVATTRDGMRMDDFPAGALPGPWQVRELQAFLRTPAEWEAAFRELHAAIFPLGEGEFLMLGDNSPRSADSRLWPEDAYFVPRELLLGEALFVVWPPQTIARVR